jgi:hypothetical protein
MNIRSGALIALIGALLLTVPPFPAYATPFASPTWGFSIDLPETYRLMGGDGKNTFSFQTESGLFAEFVAYKAGVHSRESLLADIQKRLNNQGESELFEYRHKAAAIVALDFPAGGGRIEGFGLCLELADKGLLLALAYSSAEEGDATLFHLSALDSIAPSPADRHSPGPITEYSCPRGDWETLPLAQGLGQARFRANDAEAAQSLIDREFMVLEQYARSPLRNEAWQRFYRAIYRDSFERLQDAAFVLERVWNVPPLENRALANEALRWVQSFTYERDFEGSDFVNLVSAVTEGRGDCDSRALLWALIMEQADIPAAIMVSKTYSHAMGLVDVEGDGARFPLFPLENKRWLVAETTASVDIGFISASMSETNQWLGITFEEP